MSNRPARFTSAEIRRAMKAAKAEGFDRVSVVQSPEGLKIVCETKPQSTNPETLEELEL